MLHSDVSKDVTAVKNAFESLQPASGGHAPIPTSWVPGPSTARGEFNDAEPTGREREGEREMWKVIDFFSLFLL